MRKRALQYLTLFLMGFVVIGCNSTDTVDQQPVPQNNPVVFPGYTFPLVDLANSIIPLPNNFLLDPTTGLVNFPGETAGPEDSTINAVNSLDGFSTLGPIIIPFRGTVKQDTVNSDTLPVYDSSTGETALVSYTFSSATAGTVVTINPILPLKPGTTYVVVLTQGIISALSNTPILSDNAINLLQRTEPLVDGNGNSVVNGLDNATAQRLEPVRQGNQAVIGAAETLTGTNRANIPFAFAFTTQTLFEALPQARTQVISANAGLVNTNPGGDFPIATSDGTPGIPTIAQLYGSPAVNLAQVPNGAIGSVYSGTIQAPQFRLDPLEGYWDQPPVKKADLDIPFLLFTPKPTMANPGPFPTVIFQHGLTRNKNDLFILANAFNGQGLAIIGIDLPFHGDLQADGVPDGSGLINPAKPRVTRDNIRQGAVHLYALNNAIFSGQSDLNGDMVPELAPIPPFFVGTSFGGIVGTSFTATEPNVSRSVFNVTAGRLVSTLVSSPAFGPPVLAGLAEAGIVPGTTDFARFVLATQAVVDDVDPLNYAAPAITGTLRGGTGLTALQQIALSDTVLLPSTQYDLANAFGQGVATPPFSQVDAIVPSALIAQAISPFAGPGVFEIAGADHGTILNPALGPTTAMITQIITFVGTGNIIDAGLRARTLPAEGSEDLAPYRNAISF